MIRSIHDNPKQKNGLRPMHLPALLASGLVVVILLTACTPFATAIAPDDPTTETVQTTTTEQPAARSTLIRAAEARSLLDEQPYVFLLDVRTEQEYAAGYIEGANLLPYDEIPQRLSELPSDLNTPIILYCRTGRRSAIAADLLLEAGYQTVYDMGGINSWPYGLVQD